MMLSGRKSAILRTLTLSVRVNFRSRAMISSKCVNSSKMLSRRRRTSSRKVRIFKNKNNSFRRII